MNEAPPIDDVPPILPSSHRDRRTGLIVFGILEILMGLFCVLVAGLMVVAQIMAARSTGAPVSMQMLLPTMFFYLGFAAVMIWLGIGSIQCRRWSRALSLILAWVWLCAGLLMVPMMVWLLPKIMSSTPAGGQGIPPGALLVVVTIQIVFMSVFFILVPGSLVFFYRSRHVKQTCEARDPVRRWTDECPLPVLAVTCMTWWGSMLMIGMPLAKLGMFPFFGVLYTGFTGALLMFVMAGLFLWIGWSWYRLNEAGWWALVTVIIAFSTSNVITFTRVEMLEVYQKLGYPQAQIDMIQQQGWMTSNFMMWSCSIWVLPMLGYVIWTRRFFRKAA